MNLIWTKAFQLFQIKTWSLDLPCLSPQPNSWVRSGDGLQGVRSWSDSSALSSLLSLFIKRGKQPIILRNHLIFKKWIQTYDSGSDKGVVQESLLVCKSRELGGKTPDDVVDIDEEAPLFSSLLRSDISWNNFEYLTTNPLKGSNFSKSRPNFVWQKKM